MGEMELKYLIMIMGMAFVTYIPRYLPLAVLSEIEIPQLVIDWLKYVPPAILAALLAPGILIVNDKIVLTYHNIFLLASLPTFVTAIYKRNIFLTVIVGMVSVFFLQLFL